MNEQEWLSCEEPQSLFGFLSGRISPRKVRLFAVACCRMLTSELTVDQGDALEKAEQYADRTISDDELRKALVTVLEMSGQRGGQGGAVIDHLTRAVHATLYLPQFGEFYFQPFAPQRDDHTIPLYAPSAFASEYAYALHASINVAHAVGAFAGAELATRSQEPLFRNVFLAHAKLLRGIVGNPFRGGDNVIDKISRGNPSIKLSAAHVYLTSSFYRVPELAHALAHEGNLSSGYLSYMLTSSRVKGSWLVDAVLGIE